MCVSVCVRGGWGALPMEENACKEAAMSSKSEERQLRGAGTEV